MSKEAQNSHPAKNEAQKTDADSFEFTPLNPADFTRRYTDQDQEFVKIKNLVRFGALLKNVSSSQKATGYFAPDAFVLVGYEQRSQRGGFRGGRH